LKSNIQIELQDAQLSEKRIDQTCLDILKQLLHSTPIPESELSLDSPSVPNKRRRGEVGIVSWYIPDADDGEIGEEEHKLQDGEVKLEGEEKGKLDSLEAKNCSDKKEVDGVVAMDIDTSVKDKDSNSAISNKENEKANTTLHTLKINANMNTDKNITQHPSMTPNTATSATALKRKQKMKKRKPVVDPQSVGYGAYQVIKIFQMNSILALR
jgi:hypothetical protein